MDTTSAVRRASTTLVILVTTVAVGLGLAGSASADSLGVDVSSWQHTRAVNWGRVRADHTRFAFIKATEGTGYINPYFRGDWARTRRVGLYRGAYHFARPQRGTARAQARFFVRVAGRMHQRGDLPPVLDLETTGGLRPRALQQWTRTWLRTVRHATGRRPIVYTSPVFWRTALGNTHKFRGYRLWIAHYGVVRPQVPGGWRTWTFWQGRRNGRVAGIRGVVDRNAFHGSMRRLRQLAQARPGHPHRHHHRHHGRHEHRHQHHRRHEHRHHGRHEHRHHGRHEHRHHGRHEHRHHGRHQHRHQHRHHGRHEHRHLRTGSAKADLQFAGPASRRSGAAPPVG